jgi:hypothetical protein
MTPIEFLDIYNPLKKKGISSIRLFFDVMTAYIKNENGVWSEPNFHKVAINNDIPLNREDFTIWTEDYYNYMVDFVGMSHSEILIHSAPKESFSSLDEFMYYVRLIGNKNNAPNSFIKYPHLKEGLLSEADFRRELYFYIDTMFMNKEDEVLLGIPIANYIEGYFYFNMSSGCLLGCDLTDKYLALDYCPYI